MGVIKERSRVLSLNLITRESTSAHLFGNLCLESSCFKLLSGKSFKIEVI